MRIVVKAAQPPNVREFQEAKRLAELAASVLPRTRDAAEKWRNGIIALIGVITIVSAFKGPSSLSAFPANWKAVVLGLITGSAAVALLSLSLAMLAAFGWPSEEKIRTVDRLAAWENVEARRTVTRLRWSMVAAVIFIVLFIVALGVASVAPTARPGIELIRRDGTTICGKSVSIANANVMLQTQSVTITVPAAQIATLQPVSECSAS